MSDLSFPPLPGSAIFNALKDERTIVMAANTRSVPGVARGILRAAKDLDAPLLFELARSESNLEGGYTGLTPSDYSKRLAEVADHMPSTLPISSISRAVTSGRNWPTTSTSPPSLPGTSNPAWAAGRSAWRWRLAR